MLPASRRRRAPGSALRAIAGRRRSEIRMALVASRPDFDIVITITITIVIARVGGVRRLRALDEGERSSTRRDSGSTRELAARRPCRR